MYSGFHDPEKNHAVSYDNVDITGGQAVIPVMEMKMPEDRGEMRPVVDFPVVWDDEAPDEYMALLPLDDGCIPTGKVLDRLCEAVEE